MSDTRTDLRLAWMQIRNTNRLFWRSPMAAFFTLALPLIFLVLFSVIFGSDGAYGGYDFSQFFAPRMAVFAAVSSTFTNLTIRTSFARQYGLLKRVRGTPLPAWVYMVGMIGSGVWIAVISVVLVFAVGWAFFGFIMIWDYIGSVVLVFVVGIATFSALGLAVSSVIKNADSSPAIANGVFLPMTFMSDIFVPLDDAPRWLVILGDILPLKHFAVPFGDAFNPVHTGQVLGWENIAVMGVWLAAGTVVVTRFFSWDPRGAE